MNEIVHNQPVPVEILAERYAKIGRYDFHSVAMVVATDLNRDPNIMELYKPDNLEGSRNIVKGVLGARSIHEISALLSKNNRTELSSWTGAPKVVEIIDGLSDKEKRLILGRAACREIGLLRTRILENRMSDNRNEEMEAEMKRRVEMYEDLVDRLI